MNLPDLIRAQKTVTGRTWDQLADRTGGAVSAKRLQQIALSGIKEFPEPDTIRALAVAFDVTERDIVDAVMESVGLPVHRGPSSTLLTLLSGVRGTEDLTDAEARAIVGMVRASVAHARSDQPPAASGDR